jgi:diguanylate cyclase (GGDEF)-like protein
VIVSAPGGKPLHSNVTPFSALAPEPTISQRQVLLANQQLQRHLELDRLTQTFFNLCNKVTVVDGIELKVIQTSKLCETKVQGELTQHKAKYNLSIDGHPLSSLSFHRRKRFREQELANLESIQGALVYPLRNAIMYEKLLQESLTDPLTNTGNRRAFEQQLAREADIASRYTTPLSLIMVDIDHFKQINDRHGHKIGDKALVECVNRLQASLRRSDNCFRLGGEEFALLLHNTPMDKAKQVAERALSEMRKTPLITSKARIKLTCSAGISEFDGCPNRLYDFADQALYKAKAAGRDQVQVG